MAMRVCGRMYRNAEIRDWEVKAHSGLWYASHDGSPSNTPGEIKNVLRQNSRFSGRYLNPEPRMRNKSAIH